MYYLSVYQPEEYPIVKIDIRRDERRGRGVISARKVLLDDRSLAAATIYPNVTFSDEYTPEEARNVAEWWRVAATAAETLDGLIKTPEDLSRPVTAYMVGKTVVVNFVSD